ncbi:MAG: Bro-N domain-containing protein [Mariprofundaceae bacterium]|nr:Bro-N domain-containing protein [Mariprofundaceae bacterium]
MDQKNKIQLFQDQAIRTHWDENKEVWYFSVQDIVQVLSESKDTKQYIKKMKSRDSELNSNWGTICTLVKMIAEDGKFRNIQASDTEGIFRIIQSIPSPKAEPFKRWLAKVGAERIEETEDPELAFDRAMATYLKKGYSKDWINQRLKSIEVRKGLTDEWQERGVKEGLEYAILTNEITQAWADKSVKDYKKLKGLKKESLRDNMSNLELVLNMLAEVSTTEISKQQQPGSLEENKNVARKGGTVAKKARVEIEKQTGKPVLSNQNTKKISGD